jgi:hypothetical protein
LEDTPVQEIDLDYNDINNQVNNKFYDSDIFVMSNTTFDEDLASISSRRVSAGRKLKTNDLLSFVDNKNELMLKGEEAIKINDIASQLFA